MTRKTNYRIALALSVGLGMWIRYGLGWGWVATISFGALAFFPAAFAVSTTYATFRVRSKNRRVSRAFERIERAPEEERSEDEVFEELLGAEPEPEKAKS